MLARRQRTSENWVFSHFCVSMLKQAAADHQCPEGVTGGKTFSEYMFSELPQIADIVRSRFTIERTHSYCGSRVLGPSNSMLGCGPTTPQDNLEKRGFGRRRERERGHRRHGADADRRPTH